jgi:hypothetical protein
MAKFMVIEIIVSRRVKHRQRIYHFFGYFILLLVVVCLSYGWLSHHQKKQTAQVVAKQTLKPKILATSKTTPIALVPSYINGQMVSTAQANQVPLAVVIENSPESRPQAGLSQAALVFEVLTEGGITRYLAVYNNPATPIKVGPIRSARTFFVTLAKQFQAVLIHVGGSQNALNLIPSLGLNDLDQMKIGSPLFTRDLSKPVGIDHTVYSSTDQLNNYIQANFNWPSKVTFTPWSFNDDVAKGLRPDSQRVSINYSTYDYMVMWQYSPTNNSYQRFLASQAQTDANTGQPILAKDVIIQTVNTGTVVSGNLGFVSSNDNGYILSGSGGMTILKNGVAVTGTWKSDSTGFVNYYNANGSKISLVRGNIWVELVPPNISVTYQ